MSSSAPSGFRAGFVAVVGRPNVGKSTLVNTLLGEKVAITSPKAQTTRTRIHGILNRPDSQVVFVDTPGLTPATDALRQAMRRITGHAAADADVRLVVVECRGERPGLTDADIEVLQTVQQGGPVVLAINKIDKLERKDLLLPWIETYTKAASFAAIIPISAREGDGLDELLQVLVPLLPESSALFPVDLYTDQTERFLCAELVREQLLLQLREEVPHTAAVVIESFEDERDDQGGICRIEGRIIIERDSQKGIVVGKGGQAIKALSQAARLQMERVLGSRVFLRLTVHVERDWTGNARLVRELGIDEERET